MKLYKAMDHLSTKYILAGDFGEAWSKWKGHIRSSSLDPTNECPLKSLEVVATSVSPSPGEFLLILPAGIDIHRR